MSMGQEAINEMHCNDAARGNGMTQVQGEVASHTKAKNAFRIEQTWYNLGPGIQLPDRFDTISFDSVRGGDNREYMQVQHTVLKKGEPRNFSGGGGGGAPKAGGASTGGGKSGYDNLGQQVGNAITNATRLLAGGSVVAPEGKLVETMVALAKQIMQAGDDVRKAHESKPMAAPAPSSVTQYNAPPDPVPSVPEFDDEDIPF